MGHINAKLCGLLLDLEIKEAFENPKEKNINSRAAGWCMRLLEEMANVRNKAAADERARAFDQGNQHNNNNSDGGPDDRSAAVDGAVVKAKVRLL
mmetsp:Transcript_44390/g.87129  ORF Transcript_44390/g.87129 Transcript_44390/m.87129 type:complete len:95 (-) Transcript_44390:1028-1312(-)